MNEKNFFSDWKNISSVGIANIIPTIISGFFWFYVASFLKVEEYGEIGYLLGVGSILATISMLGTGSSIIVYTAKGENIIATISFFVILSSTIMSLIMYLIFENLGISIWIIGFVIFGIIGAEFLGRKAYRTYAKFIILQRILMVIFAILFYNLIGYEGIILGIGISFIPFSIKFFKIIKNNKFQINYLVSRKNFLLNNYVLELSRTLGSSIDKIVIAPLFGFMILGNYHLGIQFLSVLTIIPTIVYQYTLPRDSNGENDYKLKKITILTSVIIAIMSFFILPEIIQLFFPKYFDSIEIIKVLSFTIIPISINMMYISELLGNLKSKVVLYGSGIFLIVEIIMIIILGDFMGAIGMGIALLIGHSAESCYLFNMNKKFKNLEKI